MPRSARRATTVPAPRRAPRRRCASRFARRFERAVGAASPRRRRRPARPASRAACASKRWWKHCSGSASAALSFHSTSTRRRSASGSSGSSPTRAVRTRGDPLQQHAVAAPSSAATVSASNRSVLYSRTPVSPPAPSPSARASSRTWSSWPVCSSSDSSARPAQRQRAPCGVLEDEHHLEQRRVAQAALRLQRLHQLLERHVLVGERPQRHLAHPRQQLAEGRRRRTGPCAAPAC